MSLEHAPSGASHIGDEPLLIDIKTTCQKLNLSRPTVNKLLDGGILKSVMCGRRVLVNYVSVIAFSEGRTTTTIRQVA